MSKLTRQVLIRLTEDEYKKLKSDAEGFKSLSYYLRSLLKERRPLSHALKDMSKVNLAKLSGIDSKTMVVTKTSVIPKRVAVRRILKKAQVGRNDPCPCGSGKKFKKCCMINENK